MAGETKSLFQRLQERRAAMSAGDPTGGDQMKRGKNQPPVQAATAANLTDAQRKKRIADLEAEIAAMKK